MSFLRSIPRCNSFARNTRDLVSWLSSRPVTTVIRDGRRNLGTSSETIEESDEARKLRERHIAHRRAMKEKFPEGWNPPRKISREAMQNLRALHSYDPQSFSTPVLADRFQISPEAVRRILKSKWMPSKKEKAKLVEKERRRKKEYTAKSVQRELRSTLKTSDSTI